MKPHKLRAMQPCVYVRSHTDGEKYVPTYIQVTCILVCVCVCVCLRLYFSVIVDAILNSSNEVFAPCQSKQPKEVC